MNEWTCPWKSIRIKLNMGMEWETHFERNYGNRFWREKESKKVTLTQHKSIVSRVLRSFGWVAHHVKKQDGHDFGHRSTRSRMTWSINTIRLVKCATHANWDFRKMDHLNLTLIWMPGWTRLSRYADGWPDPADAEFLERWKKPFWSFGDKNNGKMKK